MKIVICPDKFKGSISSRNAALAIEAGLLSRASLHGIELETVIIPVADGGEGTLDALVCDEQRISTIVTGTDGVKISAEYGYIGDTAVIESAAAAGLTLISEEKRNPMTATTYGVGELILDALSRGFRKILLTVGGSGTDDGGCGMFAALGAVFKDKCGNEFVPTGKSLSDIAAINLSRIDQRLKNTEITIATDVTNPLLGELGATYVYAPQKGATPEMLPVLENGMENLVRIIKSHGGKAVENIAGCGAGGGIPTLLLAFYGDSNGVNHRIIESVSLRSGISSVLEAAGFERALDGAYAVVTGEGKIDRQSVFGKAVSGITDAARGRGVLVFCVAGVVGDGAEELYSRGVKEIFSLSDIAPSTEYSMEHADKLLTQIGEIIIDRILGSKNS